MVEEDSIDFDADIRAVVALMGACIPDARIIVHRWSDDALTTLVPLASSVSAHALAVMGDASKLRPQIRYRPHRSDPGVHHAITDQQIHAGSRAGLHRWYDFAATFDERHQLRVLIDDDGPVPTFCGFYRNASQRPFAQRDVDRLQSLVPRLRKALEFARSVGTCAACRTLQLIDQPGAVVDDHGDLLYLNDSAFRSLGVEKACLMASDPKARRASVAHGVDVVVAPLGTCARDRLLGALSPRLRAVCEGLADGLSDKQLADRLGVTHSSARTYVREVYRRLGIGSRIALIRALDEIKLRPGRA